MCAVFEMFLFNFLFLSFSFFFFIALFSISTLDTIPFNGWLNGASVYWIQYTYFYSTLIPHQYRKSPGMTETRIFYLFMHRVS
ncbi:hypothetical protein BCR42DRAFT_128793 [Absidia repens]|uniref:Uncharacterized protein n=1 Tax=Absidia repens TaxID=90262 RepID=A0A1X2IVJ6_9FUNG|nr:hypothetical protein BCR42DRAFT_128793 [Absidia repens]